MFMIATPLAPCAGLIGQINAIWHMVLGFKGYKWLEWLITQQQQGTFADLGGFTLMYNSMAWFVHFALFGVYMCGCCCALYICLAIVFIALARSGRLPDEGGGFRRQNSLQRAARAPGVKQYIESHTAPFKGD